MALGMMAMDGNGAISRTPSLRSSIHFVRAVVRGCRGRGRVSMRVNRVGYWRSRARRAWRKGRTWWGREACEGYRAGERREGIMMRWIVVGGVRES